jgi:OmpA-OmpF porin, OOP family
MKLSTLVLAMMAAAASTASFAQGAVSSSGSNILSGTGNCVNSGFTTANANCLAAPVAAPAIATSQRAPTAQTVAPAAAAPLTGGYALSSTGAVARNSFGQCVRTSFWTPAHATVECEGGGNTFTHTAMKLDGMPAPVMAAAPAVMTSYAAAPAPIYVSEPVAAPIYVAPVAVAPVVVAPAPMPAPVVVAPTPRPAPVVVAPAPMPAPVVVAPAPVVVAPAPVVAAPAPVAAPTPVAAAQSAVTVEKVTFAADAFFDVNKAVLKPEAKAKLDDLASKIKAITLEVIIAVGHTDSDASDAYNQKLSVKRAEAVKAYLVGKGIEANRVYTEGKGEKQPVADNKTKEGKAKNRRVEIEVVGTRSIKK